MTVLSPHFSLRELTNSQTAARLGIRNQPDLGATAALAALAWQVLEPVRLAHGGRPVRITSGYRSAKLNAAIGGSARSQHMRGQAVDFEIPGVSNAAVARWIADVLQFDQLILEAYTPGQPTSGWVHVSFGANNRREVLTWNRRDGYRRGLNT